MPLPPDPNRRRLPGEGEWGELYPFEPHFTEIDGCRYHYLDEGPSQPEQPPPTLLFVHGNPTWSFHWRRLVLAYRDKYRCVVPDHLGCGYSDLQLRPLRLADHIENLSTLVEKLDLQRVTLVAQDWGGAIGLGTALRANGRFERVVLLNTGAFPPWYIPWRIRACRMPFLGRWAVQGLNGFSLAALRMTLNRTPRLDPRVEAAYVAPYDTWRHRQAVYQFVRDIPATPRHPTWQTLDQIERNLADLASLPKMLVWGMRDWCFTPACLDRFCEIWPEAQVHRLGDVGHWTLEDAPQEVESLITQFLQNSPPSKGGARGGI